MLRIERAPGTLTLVSRLARPRALVVLAVALAGAALAARSVPAAAVALGALAALVVVFGGRTVRAALGRGRVRVSGGAPLARVADRPLADFVGARVETLGEARRRKAERRARDFLAHSGGAALPSWLHAPEAPGTNDHLRRLVLEPRAAEPPRDPLPLTAWLAEDELEPARREVEERLRGA